MLDDYKERQIIFTPICLLIGSFVKTLVFSSTLLKVLAQGRYPSLAGKHKNNRGGWRFMWWRSQGESYFLSINKQNTGVCWWVEILWTFCLCSCNKWASATLSSGWCVPTTIMSKIAGSVYFIREDVWTYRNMQCHSEWIILIPKIVVWMTKCIHQCSTHLGDAQKLFCIWKVAIGVVMHELAIIYSYSIHTFSPMCTVKGSVDCTLGFAGVRHIMNKLSST